MSEQTLKINNIATQNQIEHPQSDVEIDIFVYNRVPL